MSVHWPDLASLELFLLVVEYGSIGRAATEVGLTQASASRRLDTLERELGIPLLVRDTTGSRPTAQGRTVADWAQAVIEAARDLDSGVAALRRHRKATLQLAASMTVAEYLVPGWLARLRELEPEIEVGLQVLNSEDVAEQVHNGTADMGFIESYDLPRDIAATRVRVDRLVAVVAPGHSWARRRASVSAFELASTPLVMRERGSGTRTTLEHALTEALGIGPTTPALELSSNAAVKVAVLSGAAPAVLSQLAVAAEIADGRLREVDIDGIDLRRPLRAVWRSRTRLTEPGEHLVRIAAGRTG
ncbi:DNA-binding transcriptional LysR family regulator [Nocardiopsis mwathae]|uniref:DNA-binding transcriptional LysR family regulator n=1 Tax=Nocardiopsis mwathae TaxID=1472723 RepID=A0A7X0D4Q5_9ACTN|nr:LysR family transcriptional regulator [Nocardiopsis mwathae]MBB6171557.1 DNA-binding transcriptional LysR family regulator [Nocardiopsis mwathae]